MKYAAHQPRAQQSKMPCVSEEPLARQESFATAVARIKLLNMVAPHPEDRGKDDAAWTIEAERVARAERADRERLEARLRTAEQENAKLTARLALLKEPESESEPEPEPAHCSDRTGESRAGAGEAGPARVAKRVLLTDAEKKERKRLSNAKRRKAVTQKAPATQVTRACP